MSLHLHALDVYRPGESVVHRYDPRLKIVLVALFVLAVALTPDGGWPVYALLWLLVLGTTLLSRVGVGHVQRRAAVALPFALAAVTVVFTTPGRALLATRVLGRDLAVTDAGLVHFGGVLLKSWLSVQAAVVLTATTLFPDLLRAMRSLRVPRILVGILGFTYRYLFVIGDEALRMMRARAARSGASRAGGSFEPGLRSERLPAGGKVGGSLLWRARVAGGMAGSLFLRSIERSERIYGAMQSRGYDGEIRILRAPPLRGRDVLVALPLVLLLVALPLLARIL